MHQRRAVLLAVLLAAASVSDGGPSAFLPLGFPRDANPDMPLPLGVRLSYYMQNQTYELKDLKVGSPNPMIAQALTMAVEQAGTLDIENRVTQGSVQADVWLLPFFNVFGILGNLDGKTSFDLDAPAPFGRINVDYSYNGLVYGVGGMLAGGYRSVFASLTGIYTDTTLKDENSASRAWVLQPRAGVRLTPEGAKDDVSLWAGAMYQDATEEHSGTITLSGVGDVSYDVKLEDRHPWNYLVGVSASFDQRWEFTLEGGLGDRQNVEVVAGYRF